MNFKKWVKSIQTAGYNGARTVVELRDDSIGQLQSKFYFRASAIAAKEYDIYLLYSPHPTFNNF